MAVSLASTLLIHFGGDMENSSILRTLKGIGEKTEKLFSKLGIFTISDLLSYYPRDYDCYEGPIEVSCVQTGKKSAVAGRINRTVEVKKTGRITVVTTVLSGIDRQLTLTWYNMPFLRNTLKKGELYVFRGLVVKKKGRLVMEHPDIFTSTDYQQKLHSLQPIYGLCAGLTNNLMIKTMHQILDERRVITDYLPEDLRNRYHLSEYNFSISEIHFPKDREHMLLGRRRLVFDEFLLFILAIQQLKEKTEETKNEFAIKPVWETEELIENLPYQLTSAQRNVWKEIERDMTGHVLMSRLVQGDVGSGKTIIAFLAMILAAENGYQSALMVPTEVLAKQHYESLCGLLKEQGLLKYRVILLTGSNTAKEKRLLYERIELGTAKMIIGTHALIQEAVIYKNMALVITDEQHRFGVRQREGLASKGSRPHILVMSATPIPRTLAIILYGDLDICIIDELPAARLPIKNCVVDVSYRQKAYSFIQKEIAQGRQAYIICPMVEESEGLEAENVTDYSKQLMELFPKEIVIAALHGKMKASMKNAVMEAFAKNEIQVLVSTTVVEVGVNVPNAVVMIIENAERFGLAQLHQLRGRVGRGVHQSYCIFIQGNTGDDISKRLKILEKSNDGFYIAGEDLKLRGPGDLFGIRQSGILEFQIADIFQDAGILKEASEAAAELLSRDPDLFMEQNARLKEKLESYMKNQLETLGI